MIRRYLEASSGTYSLFRPWLPYISLAIILGHIGFSLLNVLQDQSESFLLRGLAIFAVLPYLLCAKIERFQVAVILRSVFLLAIFLTGPLFLLAGLFNELRQASPDIVVVIRREFEFLASFGVFLLASVDLVVALWIGFTLSTLFFLIVALSMSLNWNALEPTWTTLMSGYIIIYIALVLNARRRSDQAASRSELSEAIGSSIAHELRTPLLSIKTKASALREVVPKLMTSYRADNDLEKKRLSLLANAPDSIVEEAESATTLIDIFLMNVSGPTGSTSNSEVFLLDDALDEAVKRYPYKSESERNAIQCQAMPTTPIRGPRILLIHIIFNLLKNSFEQLGTVVTPVVKIEAHEKGDKVKLIFTDNGPGITTKDLPRVFEPFYTSTAFGTGIGLAFCKAAIENQFTGSIRCESEPGKFTSMMIELPLDTQ